MMTVNQRNPFKSSLLTYVKIIEYGIIRRWGFSKEKDVDLRTHGVYTNEYKFKNLKYTASQ